MRYALCRLVLGDPREVPISPENFSNACNAHERMQLVVASEEKFDAIARNYLDFESDMLTIVLEATLVGFGKGMEQMGNRRLLNRKLSNLLSATRSYVDFMNHSAKVILPTEADTKKVVGLFSEHYDNSLAYRALEILRNHAQHAGFPIQQIRYSFTPMQEMPNTPLKQTVAPLLDTEVLKQNTRLKKQVVDELAQRGETVNLKRLVREYIASMASVHDEFRERVSPIFSKDASFIQELAELFASSTGTAEVPVPLYAASFNDKTLVKRISLDDGLKDYGDFLIAGNVHFTQANISFVSGELEKDA